LKFKGANERKNKTKKGRVPIENVRGKTKNRRPKRITSSGKTKRGRDLPDATVGSLHRRGTHESERRGKIRMKKRMGGGGERMLSPKVESLAMGQWGRKLS